MPNFIRSDQMRIARTVVTASALAAAGLLVLAPTGPVYSQGVGPPPGLARIKQDGLSGDAAIKRAKQLYGEAPSIRSFMVNYRTNAELKRLLEDKLAELEEDSQNNDGSSEKMDSGESLSR